MEEIKRAHHRHNAQQNRRLEKVINTLHVSISLNLYFSYYIDILVLAPEQKISCIDALSKLSQGKNFTIEDIEVIAELPDSSSSSSRFYSVLREEALKLKANPVVSLLEHPKLDGTQQEFNSIFKRAETCNNFKV